MAITADEAKRYAAVAGDALTAERVALRRTEAERDEARAEAKQAHADYERVCAKMARMHAAALGEVRGPIVGLVEDVAAVRAERDAALRERDEAEVQRRKRPKTAARLAKLRRRTQRLRASFWNLDRHHRGVRAEYEAALMQFKAERDAALAQVELAEAKYQCAEEDRKVAEAQVEALRQVVDRAAGGACRCGLPGVTGTCTSCLARAALSSHPAPTDDRATILAEVAEAVQTLWWADRHLVRVPSAALPTDVEDARERMLSAMGRLYRLLPESLQAQVDAPSTPAPAVYTREAVTEALLACNLAHLDGATREAQTRAFWAALDAHPDAEAKP